MDVNGYIVKIKMAEAQTEGENVIELQYLREAFKNNQSWDLKDGSDLLKLLKFVAIKSGEQFDAKLLKFLGILMCDGDFDEKMHELYDFSQGEQMTIAWSDKDLKYAFNTLMYLATEAIIKSEQILLLSENPFTEA